MPGIILFKPITLETLKEDKNLLEKVVSAIGKAKPQDTINISEEFFPLTVQSFLFNISHELGCNTGCFFPKKYLELLVVSEEKAKEYIDGLMIKPSATIKNSFGLNKIIPGMPQAITESAVKEDENTPQFLLNDASKIGQIYSFSSKEEIAALKNIFKGKTVVDLAAGTYGAGAKISGKLGAIKYTGCEIDPRSANDSLWEISRSFDGKENGSVETFSLACTDIRTFLRKMPSNLKDTIVLISGVDEYILGSVLTTDAGRKASEVYVGDVSREISRVVGENSCVISYESFYPSQEEGFNKKTNIRKSPKDLPLFVLEK